MSHIFDALRRSEAEQSGIEPDEFSLATELLQVAEAETLPQLSETEEPLQVAESEASEPQTRDVRRSVTDSPTPFDQVECLPVSILPKSKLVAVTEKESLAAEKFRFLAVRLRQLQSSRPLKKVLITSTMPEEGKSLVAANLACTLGTKRQQKTLLLEGDLRRPTLAPQLGLGRIRGLSEWLQSGAATMPNIYRLDALGLWILPAGTAPQNPLELMQTGRLSPLMEQLTARFDWIVIDSPPVLPLADASLWMRVADGILLVAREGKTEKGQLKRGMEALGKSPLLGVVLNNCTSADHTNYYQRYHQTAVHLRSDNSERDSA